MKYETSTWRIRVTRNQYVELSITGNNHQQQESSPGDVLRAANIMKEVGHALNRIAKRWAKVEAVEAKETAA
jgi:hypothetical protein